VLAFPQALEQTIGLLLGHGAVRDCGAQPGPRVPEADVPDGFIELAWRPSRTQSLAFPIGDPAGLDHLVESLQEALASSAIRLALGIVIHGQELIETLCRYQVVTYGDRRGVH
jgi:hypothetical protein